jgi:hypothetical protein
MALIGYDVFYIQHKMTVDKLISLGLLITGGLKSPKHNSEQKQGFMVHLKRELCIVRL